MLAQAAAEEVGLHVQRTSPTIGGVFVRGLTGTKVNVFVDGVRYTTSAQRGGISTFFNLVEPEALETVEVVRGPSSAEYGSDALGGTVQLLTRVPVFSGAGRRLTGSWTASGGSADASAGSALALRYAAPTFGVAGTLAGRRVNTLRPGGGVDSHDAVTRFLGLPSSAAIDGRRLPDTAFTQYGGTLRANWALTPHLQLSAGYLRGQQDGGKRYDQLLGGDGNLVADLRNLMSDHFHARLERVQRGLPRPREPGLLVQRPARGARQPGRQRQPARERQPRAGAHDGARAAGRAPSARPAATTLTLGGDVYRESIVGRVVRGEPGRRARSRAPRARAGRRALRTTAASSCRTCSPRSPAACGCNGALRCAAASYEASAGRRPLVNGSAAVAGRRVRRRRLHVPRGRVCGPGRPLRAGRRTSRAASARRDVTDLGTFGLTGSGYEVSAREVEGLGATRRHDGRRERRQHAAAAVRVLTPETSLAYELRPRAGARRAAAPT